MSNKNDKREREVLLCMTSLPQQMVRNHGIENMPEFLLHNLAQQGCFNFTKAAYFVDNVDFNHLKGVAGIARHELYDADHWKNQEHFSQYMKQSQFNQKVRTIERASADIKNKKPDQVVQEIGKILEFANPNYVMWHIKYDNAGLLVFESEQPQEPETLKEHLYNALHLFGFCPIF